MRILVSVCALAALAACGGGGGGGSDGSADGVIPTATLTTSSGGEGGPSSQGSALLLPPGQSAPPPISTEQRIPINPHAGEPLATNVRIPPGGLVGNTWTPVGNNWFPGEEHKTNLAEGNRAPNGPLQPVPEPETFVLFAMGLGTLLVLVRHFRLHRTRAAA